MDIFIKCIAVAVLTAVSATMLKRYLPEISTVILIVAAVFLFFLIGNVLAETIEFIKTLAEKANISDELISPVFKVTAISILSKIACDLCRDSGANTLITVIELCAGVVSTVLSIPLFNAVIGLVTRM
ncbi:MAG: hypothetical protein IKU84_06775 [Clostridia bacterium]|nr:hypothetical protein [Clostridia bacterium]